MNQERPPDVFDQNCPSRKVLEIVTAKWAVLVIYALEAKPQRYNQLLTRIGGISPKVLTQVLNTLQKKNVIVKVKTDSDAHADYSLTTLGKSITSPLSKLCEWAETHQNELGS